MEKMLFGLSSFELRKLAYELAVRNNKNYSFNNNLGVVSYDWYKGFMKRHSKHLSLHKPEAISAVYAMSFNQVPVDSFFLYWKKLWIQTSYMLKTTGIVMKQVFLQFQSVSLKLFLPKGRCMLILSLQLIGVSLSQQLFALQEVGGNATHDDLSS